jgi:hypothetical protein
MFEFELELEQKGFLKNYAESKAKGAEIDRIIKRHVQETKLFTRKTYNRLVPRGDTGRLSNALNTTKVKKVGNVYSYTASLEPIREGSISQAESLYPKYVEEGTTGKIFSPRGNVMTLRNKDTGLTFGYAKSVRGQQGQKFFERTGTVTKFNFSDAIARRVLAMKIRKALTD